MLRLPRFDTAWLTLLRRYRRLLGWLAIATLVLASLAPSLSRAIAFARGDLAPLGSICSAQPEAGDDAPAQDAGVQWFDHCPYCSLHGDEFGLPPSPGALAEAPAHAHAMPPLFLHAPGPLHAWASPHSRAPPHFD